MKYLLTILISLSTSMAMAGFENNFVFSGHGRGFETCVDDSGTTKTKVPNNQMYIERQGDFLSFHHVFAKISNESLTSPSHAVLGSITANHIHIKFGSDLNIVEDYELTSEDTLIYKKLEIYDFYTDLNGSAVTGTCETTVVYTRD